MRARQFISDGGFGPEDLSLLENVFDAAWQKLEGRYANDVGARETARMTLASIVVQVGKGCYPRIPKDLEAKSIEIFEWKER